MDGAGGGGVLPTAAAAVRAFLGLGPEELLGAIVSVLPEEAGATRAQSA